MSLALLAQLHTAFGTRPFTFEAWWLEQRGHRAPVRDDVDAFVDGINSFMRRGFVQRAAELRNGEGWQITLLGAKAIRSRHAKHAAKIERDHQRFAALKRQREHLQIDVAIELLTKHGYSISAPQRESAR